MKLFIDEESLYCTFHSHWRYLASFCYLVIPEVFDIFKRCAFLLLMFLLHIHFFTVHFFFEEAHFKIVNFVLFFQCSSIHLAIK
eukprot:UN13574